MTFGFIQESLFPIGSIVMGDSLTNESTVKNIYGGNSWEKVTGLLYGVGDQITTLSVVNEQLPKLTASSTFTGDELPKHKHNWSSYYNKAGSVGHYDSGTWYSYWTTDKKTNAASGGKPTGTVTTTLSGGPQTQNGKVRPKGVVTYVWRRVL